MWVARCGSDFEGDSFEFFCEEWNKMLPPFFFVGAYFVWLLNKFRALMRTFVQWLLLSSVPKWTTKSDFVSSMPFFCPLLFFFLIVSSGTIQITKGEKSSPRRGRPKLRENEACGCEIGVEEYDAHAETDWWDTRKKLPFSSAEDALEKMSFNNSVLVMMTNAGEVDLLDNYLCSLRLVGLNKYIVFGSVEWDLKHLEFRGYYAVVGSNFINDNA